MTFYPFGNGKETPSTNGTWTFSCQHGSRECIGNLVEACAAKYHPETADHLPFILCLEKIDPSKAGEACATKQGWSDWDDIHTCASGAEGNALMHNIAMATAALSPPHTYVPWPVLNGAPLDPDADLTQAVDHPGRLCK